MKRIMLLASLVLAVAVPVSVSNVDAQSQPPHLVGPVTTQPVTHKRPGCAKLFTVKMAQRAINATFHGTKNVTKKERQHLDHIAQCQRNENARPFVHWYRRRAWRAWNARCHPPFYQSLASWYNDGGATACGYHEQFGVAHKSLPCGTHVTFKLNGHKVNAVVDDRGPYVGAREWDLNQNTAAALGFGGVGVVWYHIG